MEAYMDIENLFIMAQNGTLPKDFNQWNLAGGDVSDTVAHIAARYGHLSKDFKDWSLTNENGWTVAHEAAWWGNLSKDFSLWNICTTRTRVGWSVAHAAALNGKLPKGFHKSHPDVSKMKDKYDESVEYLALENGYVMSE